MKVYGPYERNDTGRRQVVIQYDDGRITSKSYARYLMEQHLGRELFPDEHVDHIDDDRTNDTIENLQILSPEENAKKYHRFRGTETEMYIFNCPHCSKEASKPMKDVKANRKKGKAGPFCSRSCAGSFCRN